MPGSTQHEKQNLFLSFMTLIIRIPRYTYFKSQNHYQQQSTLGKFYSNLFLYGIKYDDANFLHTHYFACHGLPILPFP